MADFQLDPALPRDRYTVPTISEDFYDYMKSIEKTEPEIMSTLLPILRTKPDSGIQIVNTKFTNYATWRKDQIKRDVRTLDKQYSVLQYDEDHDTVWAVIAAKLFSVVRHRRDRIFTNYSAQYILDFAPLPPGKARRKHQRTCCKPRTVAAGLRYGLKNNLPREQDWKYAGCRDIRKPRGLSLYPMAGDVIQSKDLRIVSTALQKTPVAARLHIFEPDVDRVGNGIYRGPKYFDSKYEGQRDVLLYATEIVNGELVGVVNFPYKKLGELHVSLDVMLVQTPREDDIDEPNEELENPTYLLTNLCFLLQP
ncbi:hypothetical protein Bca52824_089240 [Brassica carinata]|uniref:Uncharacterized protein n=1 Tax=Brassica carinata TaxID=52824 RepID=A0A8X7PFB3_BRACI|nr:hypothetical protein Bca52824_089240 [Brassica carinata]